MNSAWRNHAYDNDVEIAVYTISNVPNKQCVNNALVFKRQSLFNVHCKVLCVCHPFGSVGLFYKITECKMLFNMAQTYSCQPQITQKLKWRRSPNYKAYPKVNWGVQTHWWQPQIKSKRRLNSKQKYKFMKWSIYLKSWRWLIPSKVTDKMTKHKM